MWTRCRRHARAGHDRDECLNTDTVATRRPPDAAASSRSARNPCSARVLGVRESTHTHSFSLEFSQISWISWRTPWKMPCRTHFSRLHQAPWKSPLSRFPGPLSPPLSAINVHFYCHLRNSAHYHNNNTERGGMRSPRTTDHESPTVRDGK